MTRPRLRTPQQSLPVQFALGFYEFCASLRLAVVLIFGCALTLAWATFVESHYGAAARVVNYAIYGTWWFAGLCALLGLNVFCAAAIRFPWKKHQTGFVVTHAGILLLLMGSWLSHTGGVDASLPVFEGESNWRAFEESQHFKLTVAPTAVASGSGPSAQRRVIEVPFVAGPFNWDDYRRLFWFPWSLARRDRGTVYDRDGIRLEVLDYYSDSVQLPVPRLLLRVEAESPLDDQTKDASLVELKVAREAEDSLPMRPFGGGDRQTLPHGQEVLFWMTGDGDETEAFRNAQPEGRLGPQGEIVLFTQGKKFAFAVDQLGKQKPQPLGTTGFVVELVEFVRDALAVKLLIHHGPQRTEPMVLLAAAPYANHHDYRDRVYGTFWYASAASGQGASAAANAAAGEEAAAAGPRLDILQGADRKLYGRAWRQGKLTAQAPIPSDGSAVTLFAGTPDRVALRCEQFTPSDRPDTQLLPLPFVREKMSAAKDRQARVRLTVDGRSEEFWLAGIQVDPDDGRLPRNQRRTVHGAGRDVSIVLPWDEIDVGFQVWLHKFERKLDPGTNEASYYASTVDFCQRRQLDRRLQKNVLITLNEPVNFTDPLTRRSFRIYQASFSGPFKPGDREFEQVVRGADMRKSLFQSILTVNYDPGRGLKYAGCLLIVLGIVILFYMKAYFFRRDRSERSVV
jgi:hypothetical protein